MMQQCSLLVAHLNLSHFQGLPTLHLDLHARAARRILSQGDSSDSSMGLTTFRRFRLVAALLVRSLRSFGSRWRGRGAIDFLLDPQRCPGGVRQLTVIVRHGARKVRWHYRITGASPAHHRCSGWKTFILFASFGSSPGCTRPNCSCSFAKTVDFWALKKGVHVAKSLSFLQDEGFDCRGFHQTTRPDMLTAPASSVTARILWWNCEACKYNAHLAILSFGKTKMPQGLH